MAPTDEEIYQQEEKQLNEPFNREQFYSDWQSGKKPLLESILSNYTKPEPIITPEQAQKAKFGSAMSDTLSSVAEMFAHGQGARVRNREGASNVQTTNAKLQAMNDKYNAEMRGYNGVKANAEMADFNQAMQNEMKNRGEQRQNILYDKKLRATELAAKNKREQDILDDIAKGKRDLENKLKVLKWQHDHPNLNHSSGTKEPKVVIPSDEQVRINEQAEQLDPAWVKSQGYMYDKPNISRLTGLPDGTVSTRWSTHATPEIKRSLIAKYQQEKAAEPKAYQPRPGEQRATEKEVDPAKGIKKGDWYSRKPTVPTKSSSGSLY